MVMVVVVDLNWNQWHQLIKINQSINQSKCQ